MSRGTVQSFRRSLLEAIEGCGKSRDRIVCEINEETGRNLSKPMLDKYTSSNTNYSFPSELLPAFCKATGTDKPFRILLEEIGCGLHSPADRDRLKINQLFVEKKRIEAKINRLSIKNGLQIDTEASRG